MFIDLSVWLEVLIFTVLESSLLVLVSKAVDILSLTWIGNSQVVAKVCKQLLPSILLGVAETDTPLYVFWILCPKLFVSESDISEKILPIVIRLFCTASNIVALFLKNSENAVDSSVPM